MNIVLTLGVDRSLPETRIPAGPFDHVEA